jgi:elongation factor 1-beta
MAAFNGVMGGKSYLEGYSQSAADMDVFQQFHGVVPDATKCPHAYRWYIHIAALSGIRGLSMAPPPAVAAAATPAAAAAVVVVVGAAPKAAKATTADEEDDFDVFGDDDEVTPADTPKTAAAAAEPSGGESRAEVMARLKKDAENRLAKKEASQRTLCAIEIKPWDVEQDLMALWKKITTVVQQEGLKWGESCNLADVAYGIKKIQCTFVMGVNNSSDDVVDAILAMKEEVQSCEVTSMNVL